MDIDDDTAATRDAAQAPASPGITSYPVSVDMQQVNSSSSKLPGSSNGLLQSMGAAADNPGRMDVRAPPASASLAWQPKPDGAVTLTPAVAAMADADDPGEDDVDRLQVSYSEHLQTLPAADGADDLQVPWRGGSELHEACQVKGCGKCIRAVFACANKLRDAIISG